MKLSKVREIGTVKENNTEFLSILDRLEALEIEPDAEKKMWYVFTAAEKLKIDERLLRAFAEQTDMATVKGQPQAASLNVAIMASKNGMCEYKDSYVQKAHSKPHYKMLYNEAFEIIARKQIKLLRELVISSRSQARMMQRGNNTQEVIL